MSAQWTDETDREADAYFATLSETEIRRRQDICEQQTRTAYEHRNTAALQDLHRMADALTRSLLARMPEYGGKP